MRSNVPQRFGFVIAAIALLGGILYFVRGMSQSGMAGKAVSYLGSVSKAVSFYAGAAGGAIPSTTDLLQELKSRQLIAELSEKLPGYDLPAIERLGPEEYQIRLTCPDDEHGRKVCSEILTAETPGSSHNVLRTGGHGTHEISIDMRL